MVRAAAKDGKRASRHPLDCSILYNDIFPQESSEVMPKQPPPPGVSKEQEHTSKPGMGVTHVGPVEMLSTPAMIGFMEGTAMGLLQQYLDPHERSVGARVDVRHLAPTPVPGKVKVKATFLRTEGRRYIFEVQAFAGEVKIGEGIHERAVIDPSRFQPRG